jgi:hypothetical protein
MTPRCQVIVAPNFHLSGALADRLLVAEGDAWRAPSEGDLAAIIPTDATRDDLGRLILLFALPVHLRSSFWLMMENSEPSDDFDAFAEEMANFLAFKQLQPPERAVIESVLHLSGSINPVGLWAVVNMGDDSVLVGLPGLRLRLESGEGCRLSEGVSAEVLPTASEVPAVLLLVRRPVPPRPEGRV